MTLIRNHHFVRARARVGLDSCMPSNSWSVSLWVTMFFWNGNKLRLGLWVPSQSSQSPLVTCTITKSQTRCKDHRWALYGRWGWCPISCYAHPLIVLFMNGQYIHEHHVVFAPRVMNVGFLLATHQVAHTRKVFSSGNTTRCQPSPPLRFLGPCRGGWVCFKHVINTQKIL